VTEGTAPLLLERFRSDPVDCRLPVLFAISHAGAGAAPFAGWRRWLPANVELAAVRFPGRESRIREHPIGSIDEAASVVASAIESYGPLEFAIFGQCTGALLAFEVTRLLRTRGAKLPQCLFVASQPPPDRIRVAPTIHELPDQEFYEELRRRGGIGNEIEFKSPIWNLVSSTIRADCATFSKFLYQESAPVDSSIVAVLGAADHLLREADMDGWRHHTTGRFEIRIVRGGHLIAASAGEELVPIVSPPWK
jgi:surfactin synthase thioesterase subunit